MEDKKLGDKFEAGRYRCKICGFEFDTVEGEEAVSCPICDGANYTKIG